MVGEGEASTQFWIQTRRRGPLFNSGVLLFALSITASLFVLVFIVSPLLSLSPQISRPINSFKKDCNSFIVLIVLLALIFIFFSLSPNNPDSISSVRDRTDDNIRHQVHDSREYGYSHRTAVVGHQTDAVETTTNEARKSTVGGWYDHLDRTAVDAPRTYPDLHKMPPPDDSGHRWRFHDGMPSAQQADALATRANKSSPRPDSGDGRRYDDMSFANGASSVPRALSPRLERFDEGVKILSTGTVIGVADGVARIRGLEEVAEGEIVEFDEGVVGIALHRESMDSVGAVLMDDSSIIREGTYVKATGKIVQIPVSEACLRHVVNAIARPIDGKGEISSPGSQINEETEIKRMGENQAPPPVVRRRRRRTTGRIANKGKSSEEGSGLEPPGPSSRRKTKRAFENTGTVLGVGDGIAHIHCLDNVTAGEIVEFEEGTIGIALNSDSTDNTGVVLMGDGLQIQEGSSVKATGEIAQIPVGEAYLDRVIKSLILPINRERKISVAEYGLVEETEIKPSDENRAQPPDVQWRTRQIARSIAEKGKSSEEVNDLEPPGQFWVHESTATDNKQSHLGSDTDESVPPSEEEAGEKLYGKLEANEYESPFSPMLDPPISPPRSSISERKKGGENATRDFLAAFRKQKKKQRQKSIENLETLVDSQPASPPPPSIVQSFFSSKKGKGKRVIDVPQPPAPPLPHFSAPHEQKSAAVEPPATTSRPPLPVKVRNFVEVASNSSGESPLTGAESPLHPIPPPPPPLPFQTPSWKFVLKGDYVKIGSTNSSRSVSPERDEVDFPASSESGWTPKAVNSGDMAAGSMFCPSPDVNSKADVFIAQFRAGLRLQKQNSIKQKQGVGLSNLGPASNPNQAQA